MNKKIIIGVIVILIVAVIGYFTFMKYNSPGSVEGTIITSLHIESFPTGTQMGPGMKGTETTTIKIGDIISLSGTITTDGVVDSSFKIFNLENNLILAQDCVKIKGTGGFGCSMDYPQVAGKYVLKFYIEDVEVRGMEFEVMQ
ncbi:hypothetical protein M0R19_02150 [Candidatus Pacearchaeota archaeon]|jgi:hypothetical protein|nr:hypothetical protein [Candidatus Pacearchaeota archaeon]